MEAIKEVLILSSHPRLTKRVRVMNRAAYWNFMVTLALSIAAATKLAMTGLKEKESTIPMIVQAIRNLLLRDAAHTRRGNSKNHVQNLGHL